MTSAPLHSVLKIVVLIGMILSCATTYAAQWGPERLTFLGGPAGGTFEKVAKMAVVQINDNQAQAVLNYSLTGGSVENLRRINKGEADMGIVYSGDLFLGREGQLPFDNRVYDQTHPLAVFYLAPAQLVVHAESPFRSVDDLAGKRVAVGGIGSGTAATAQRFLTALDLWDRIKPEFIGYQDAISALGHNYVDAIWVLAGTPNSAVSQAAESYPIRILDLSEAIDQSSFFSLYPFYTRATISGGTYPGVENAVSTFADQAVWVAGDHLEAELVKKSMDAFTKAQNASDAPIEIDNPAKFPAMPSLHSGAEAFWTSSK